MEKEHFEALLERISGEQYEELRARLVRYFRWERSTEPEDLADETLDRVARKLALGEAIESLERYSAGVARLVRRETATRARRREIALGKRVSPETELPVDAVAMECLQACLSKLGDEQRQMIVRYYGGSEQIRVRKEMAAEMGVGMNALRNRALRLRETLEACVMKCRFRTLGNE